MRLLLPLVGVALLLAGCTSEPAASVGPGSSGALAPDASFASDVGSPGPYEFTTAIFDDAYQHARLDAFVEATIRWWNVGDETHSVVSDDGQFPGSGPIAPHDEYVHTFLRPGDFAYHCRYHPEMTGVVVVR